MTQITKYNNLFLPLIKTKQDFPIPGVKFYDINEIFQNPDGYNQMIDEIIKNVKLFKPDAITSTEARGWLLASIVAYKLKLPFILIRKAGKLPSPTSKIKIDYEYASAELEISLNKSFQRVVFVDDILATAETAKSAVELINKSQSKVVGVVVLAKLLKFSNLQIIPGVEIKELLILE